MRSCFVLVITLLFTVVLLPQQKNKQRYNAFSGTFVLTFEGGPAIASSDYSEMRPDLAGRLSFEYFLPTFTRSSFGIRLFGVSGYISGQDLSRSPAIFRTEIINIGAGAVYSLSFKDKIFPYFFAGAGYLSFNPLQEDGTKMPNNLAGKYKGSEINFTAELGTRFLVTENLSANILINANLNRSDYLDDVTAMANNDIFFTAMAGLSYAFFTENDSDNDGIVDSKDMCADTPAGVKVDDFGCPLDSDNDGVPDYKDKCPSTPADVKVTADGCALDTDGDGIPDYQDLCPDTPVGVKVDDFGCPFDMDADGVPDYLDKCPSTPYDAAVDAKGCPVDSDLDGVPDYKDDCPDSAPGVQVDEKGCEIQVKIEEPVQEPETESNEVSMDAGIIFASGRSVLLPAANDMLDKLTARMKRDPVSRWRIESHTDNTGPSDVNKDLSQKRAAAILKYFESKGISKNRFELEGWGGTRPIAPNSTPEGRSKNRRVIITKVN